jgi:Family of unknown function (DUF5996)
MGTGRIDRLALLAGPVINVTHFLWAAFDLALTRFSGRPAPRHPGGVPHRADW